MFSFVPCVPAEGDVDDRFARPEIRLPGLITSHLRQGKRITKLTQVDEVLPLWTEVVRQIERQDLGLATKFDAPRIDAPTRLLSGSEPRIADVRSRAC